MFSTAVIRNTLIAASLGCICYAARSAPNEADQLLELSLEDLMQIKVVSTTRTALNVWKAPATVNLYNAQDIREMGFKTLYDLLNAVAGVQTYNASVGRQRAWFRGAQSEFNSKVALFIDGVPIRNLRGGFPMDMALPIDTVKSVEIVRGPGSTLYGTNALSGSIHVLTYSPSELGNRTQIKGEVGSNDSYGALVQHSQVTDGGSFSVEVRDWKSDGYSSERDRAGLPLQGQSTPQELQAARAKASFLNDKLILAAATSRFDFHTPYKGIFRPKDISDYDTQLSLQYRDTFKENIDFDFLSYYKRIKSNESETNTHFYASGNIQSFDQEFSREQTELIGAQPYVNWNIDTQNQLLLGADVQHERVLSNLDLPMTTSYTEEGAQKGEPTSPVIPWSGRKISTQRVALYAQHTLNLNDGTTGLTTGWRHDSVERLDPENSIRIGLTQDFNSNWFGKLLYGTAFREPSFVEYLRIDFGGTPPKAENMKTTEFQLGYRTDKQLSTLTLFSNRYNNYIERDNTGAIGTENFRNTGPRLMRGAEFESRISLSDQLKVFFNVDYLHTLDEELNISLPFLAHYHASAGVNYWRPLLNGKLSTNLYLRNSGEREDFDSSVTVTPGGHIRPHSFSDGFYVLNADLQYHAQYTTDGEFTLALSVKNLLDEQYYDRNLPLTGFRGVYQNKRYTVWDAQAPSRTIALTLEYRWN
jgi:outer membrane receptor for ferrienterochelin and colicins